MESKAAEKGGPKGGCWCGGDHYSSACPRSKGGGKVLSSVDEDIDASCMMQVKKPLWNQAAEQKQISSNEWDYEQDVDYHSVWAYIPGVWESRRDTRISKSKESIS